MNSSTSASQADATGTGSEMDARVRALEAILIEKGYVEPAALEALVQTYEARIGPRNGARVVARAWVDPSFKAWLLKDATAAIGRAAAALALASAPEHPLECASPLVLQLAGQ